MLLVRYLAQLPASRIILWSYVIWWAVEIDCLGKSGFPFFGQLILDCIHRTEKAMTQKHAFKAAELSMQAQTYAQNH